MHGALRAAVALSLLPLTACAGGTPLQRRGAEATPPPVGPNAASSPSAQAVGGDRPATGATSVATAQAVQRLLPLKVQGDVGFLTAKGLAKAGAGGGALIANDGTSLQPGSASRFAAGGLIANDGASLKLNGMRVASQDGGYLLGKGGLLANDGGGLIANDGTSAQGSAGGFRLSQSAGIALGQLGPVGGYQLLVVDLHARLSYLVAAEGGRGLTTDAQGGLELPVPAALKPEVRNLLAIALDPKHPELRQAVLVRVDGARAECNERRTLLTSYLRRHYTRQVGDFFQTDGQSAQAGQVQWGSDSVSSSPLLQARLTGLAKAFHAAGQAAMSRAGQSRLSRAQADWLAQVAFDRALAVLDLESILPNFQGAAQLDPSTAQGEASPGVPFAKDALGLMEQCLQELHERAKAKLEEVGPEGLAQSETVKEAEARLGQRFAIQRPQDYLDFMVEAYLLRQDSLDDQGGKAAAQAKTEAAFAAVGARRASWTRLRAGAGGFAVAAVLAMAAEMRLSEVVNAEGELDLEAALQTDLLQSVAAQGDDPGFRALAP